MEENQINEDNHDNYKTFNKIKLIQILLKKESALNHSCK